MYLSEQQKQNYREWLMAAHTAARGFDGSEQSEQALFTPLLLMDAFVKAHANGRPAQKLESAFAKIAMPEHPADMPRTMNGFLGLAGEFYKRLHTTAQKPEDFWDALRKGGAVVRESDAVFIKPDKGEIKPAGPNGAANPFTRKTQERLAMLIAHLGSDGVRVGEAVQKIYLDDLVITRGKVRPDMMRQTPYTIVQIPRLNMEIAVCEEVDNATFVKKGTVGEEFWDFFGKDKLKTRPDVKTVEFHGEAQWWSEIADFLSGNAPAETKKKNVQSWVKGKPNFDVDLIKVALKKHWLKNGKPLTQETRALDGRAYRLELPSGEKVNPHTLNNQLRDGGRGLPKGSGLAALNEEIAEEMGWEYKNHLSLPAIDVVELKVLLWDYWQKNGEPLKVTAKKTPDDKPSSYEVVFSSGRKIKVKNLDHQLSATRNLALPEGSSIAKLNEEISREKRIPYKNNFSVPKLDVNEAKAALKEYWEQNGHPFSSNTKRKQERPENYEEPKLKLASGREIRAGNLNGQLVQKHNSSIATLNVELAREHPELPGADTVLARADRRRAAAASGAAATSDTAGFAAPTP